MTSADISLHMIVKDEVEAVTELMKHAKPYFTAIYLTVSDKTAYEALKKLTDDVISVDYRKWNDRFDDARNHNWKFGEEHTYSMWLDADDAFNFDTIPKLVSIMEDCDAIYLPYYYDQDENGNVIVSHWRERIVRRSIGWTWKGWVHETLIPDDVFSKEMVDVPVWHNSDHKDQSIGRNHAILEKAYAATKDPRYIHYLGISHFTMKEWDKAIKYFEEYITVGGWDEEIYRTLVKLSECYYNKKDFDTAIRHALEAIGFMPELPMAYHNLAQYEFKQNNYKQALEWIKVAVQKKAPTNVSIYDPTSNNRSLLTGALCEHELGNHREALGLLKQVKVINVTDLMPSFEYEAALEQLAENLPKIIKYYENPRALWDNLKDNIKYDNRFRAFREQFTKPEIWSKGTVVFFCGKGYEEWGPHTLENGMGGSEEAVVYLSRELAKLGYRVTVFGEVTEPLDDYIDKDTFVKWRPWQHIDKRDTFDTLVIWRAPQFASQFKANKILVDMHDKLPTSMVKQKGDEIFMFKSNYHKDLYDVKNAEVVGNGILAEHFTGKVKKKPHSVGYFSAYYRGLECLLDMWPEIRKHVPDATLDIYYGWQSWISAEGEDDFYTRMVKKIDDLKDSGVTEHGRVDHKTLAKAMQETAVWAYPTEFDEIHCITALKAREAGCATVHTGVAALAETARGTEIRTDNIYTDNYQQQNFESAVVAALTRETKLPDPVENRYWSDVARGWQEVIEK